VGFIFQGNALVQNNSEGAAIKMKQNNKKLEIWLLACAEPF
jgi:hypothetical protein